MLPFFFDDFSPYDAAHMPCLMLLSLFHEDTCLRDAQSALFFARARRHAAARGMPVE